ncbi:TIGR02678 family protein [Halobacillus seohaensis]|uniref:TIGR02678 family protein n=1 Tax=Halobacillus seohaensis TaxID=447421 RepID=A0ABW2EMC6_9BACI
MEVKVFDEKAQEALSVLFEQFWILRSEEPGYYRRIREREHQLKRYVMEKFGFDLIIHQHFIKLEKISVEPKAWMGIQEFLEPMDYGIFCCGLAFTENRSVDDQFLLSDICEDIQDMYPGEFPLDWTNYNHRKSLVRAMRKLVRTGILKTVDGEIDLFATNEGYEVLYEVTVYARYFMRSYPDDLFQYNSAEEILASEWKQQEVDQRRKRVYRKLLFSPVVYRQGDDDPDFAYIRKFRNRLRDDLEEHTPYRLELFKNAAMLVMDEKKQLHTLFPDQKAISDVVLHFSSFLRERMHEFELNSQGELKLTSVEFQRMVEDVKAAYGHGWSKAYREGTIATISKELLQLFKEWEFGYIEDETEMIVLQSALGRMTGDFPQEYNLERRHKDAENK